MSEDKAKLARALERIAELEEGERISSELLAEKDRQILVKDKQIAQLQARMKAVYTSMSWRCTSPLRAIGDAVASFVERVDLPTRKARMNNDAFAGGSTCSYSKELSQYWDNTLEKLERAILDHDVITFDIFDTLVTRPIIDPYFLFDILATEAYRLAGVRGFRTIRTAVEDELRAETGFEADVTIEEIYARIAGKTGMKTEVVATLLSAEKSLEIKLNRPRKQVVQAFDFARKHDKKIVFMSDMYLDEDTVTSILKKNGITGYHSVLLSSTIGVRKDDGRMWVHLLKEHSARTVLHVGDNDYSDVQIPTELGIDTFRVMSPTKLFYSSPLGRTFPVRNSELDLLTAAMTGMVVAEIFGDPFCLSRFKGRYFFEDREPFGFAVIGPIVLAYVLWLMKSAIRDDIDRILFVAREGYLLKDVYDRVSAVLHLDGEKGRLIETGYLLASRRGTTVPAIGSIGDALALLELPYKGSIHNLLESRYGLTREIISDSGIANAMVDSTFDMPGMEKVVRELFDYIKANAVAERDAYLSYLESLGVTRQEEKVALSDLGYSGSIQKSLAKLLNKSLTGYYFATHFNAGYPDTHKNRFYGYFTREDDPVTTTVPAYKYHLVLESILTAPHGQFERFVRQSEAIVPQFGPADNNFTAIALVQRGIIRYCEEMIACHGQLLLDLEPDKGDVQHIFDTVISDGLLSGDIKKLLMVEDNYSSDGRIKAF